MNTSFDLEREPEESQIFFTKTSELDVPKILICLSNESQDPYTIAISWRTFSNAGCVVEFATEYGAISQSDPRFLRKSWLRDALSVTNKETVELFYEMVVQDAYLKPHAWSSRDFDMNSYDAVILGHGTDKKLRQFLESPSLHRLCGAYFQLTKRVKETPIKRSSTFMKRKSVPAPPVHVPDHMEQVVGEKQKESLENLEGPRKVVGAVGRGVLVLVKSKFTDNLSDDEFSPYCNNNNNRPTTADSAKLNRSTSPNASHDITRVQSTTKVIRAKSTTMSKLTSKLTRSSSVLAVPKRASTVPSMAPTEKQMRRVSKDLERIEKKHDEMLGRSVLYHVETTSTPAWMEKAARTVTTMYGVKGMFNTYKNNVQVDVTAALADPSQYHMGPTTLTPWAYVDPQHHYVSARYPGDTPKFAQKVLLELEGTRSEWEKERMRGAIPENIEGEASSSVEDKASRSSSVARVSEEKKSKRSSSAAVSRSSAEKTSANEVSTQPQPQTVS